MLWKELVTKGDAPSPRGGSSIAAFSNKLYVFGGANREQQHYNDLFSLDLESGIWTKLNSVTGTFPSPRSDHSLVGICNPQESSEHLLLIFGGQSVPSKGTANVQHYNDVFIYSSLSNQWESLQCNGSVPSPRSSHSAVFRENGQEMIVFGGSTMDGISGQCFVLDIESKTWSEIVARNSELVVPRQMHSAAMISKDVMAIYGGKGNGSILDDLCFLDLRSQEWIKIVIDPVIPMCSGSMEAIHGQIITCGGFSGDSYSNNLVLTESKPRIWNASIFREGPPPRIGPCSTCFGNKMYVFGGIDLEQDLNDLHYFELEKKIN